MKKILLSVPVLLAAVLFLRYDRIVSESVLEALSVCIRQIVPALFPFMTVSSLIISADLAAPFCRFLPMHLFGLPSCTAPVFITGLLSGFPVGAAGSAQLYASGKIRAREAAVLCAISSHVSPAFCIGVIGILWNAKDFGLFLYVCSLVSAVIGGLVFRLTASDKKASAPRSVPAFPAEKFIPALCRSVSDAASACLRVTAFIVFFRLLCTLLSMLFPLPDIIISPLLEFSLGCADGAGKGGIAGAFITGFAVGFSGLCVLLQICSFLAPHGIPLAPVFLAKSAEGLLTALAAACYSRFRSMTPVTDVFSVSETCSPAVLFTAVFVLLLVSAAGCTFLPRRIHTAHKKKGG
ncbi:MAG: hypothetical protein IJC71_01380 [Clostridia bacterium]|nr:hypothetical protein [Clostridia bacterium]